MKIFPIKNIQLQNTKNIYCSEINTNKNNIENRSLSSNSNISSDVYKSNFLPFKSLKMRGISLNNDFCDTSFYRDADTLRQSVDVIKENFPEGTDIMDFACSNGEETISIYSLLGHNPQYKIHGFDRCPKAIDLANAGIYSVMTKGICDSFLTGENCNDENYDLKNKFYKIMDVVENPDFKNDESLKLVRLMNSFPEIKLKFFKLKDEHKKELSYNLGDINDIKNLGPQKVGAIYFRNAFYIPTKNYDLNEFDISEIYDKTDKKQVINDIVDKIYDKLLPGGILVLGNLLKDHVYIAGDDVPEDEKLFLPSYFCHIYKESPLHAALSKDNRFIPIYFTEGEKSCMSVPTIWQKVS